MNNALTLRILFPTAVNAELVANPVILSILFFISVILAFKSVFLARSLVLGIFFYASLIFFSKSDLPVSYLVFKTNSVVLMLSTFVTNYIILYSVFLTTSFFITLLTLAKSSGTGVNFTMSILCTSVFKLAKFLFNAELPSSTCVTFLDQF